MAATYFPIPWKKDLLANIAERSEKHEDQLAKARGLCKLIESQRDWKNMELLLELRI